MCSVSYTYVFDSDFISPLTFRDWGRRSSEGGEEKKRQTKATFVRGNSPPSHGLNGH